MSALRLGTRKSALAQTQSVWVADRLKAAFPELRIELVPITTTGDSLTATPSTSGKTLFTKELEDALLDNRIDLAVHSMKDMPAELPKGLVIGAVPEREDARDAWVARRGLPFEKLSAGARVGTGAIRRQAQLRHARPDLVMEPLRGNVETRLRLLREGTLDGIILAAAGLKRLQQEKAATEFFSFDQMLPAVGQGALAIEIRGKDANVLKYLKAIDHALSHQASLAERSFLKALGGSCQTPIAGIAAFEGAELVMKGLVISPDGKTVVKGKENGRGFDAEGIGKRLGDKLLAAGADKILKEGTREER